MLNQKEYAKRHGAVCPFCGTGDITPTGSVRTHDDGATQNIKCNNTKCGRKWVDIYELKGYIELVDE